VISESAFFGLVFQGNPRGDDVRDDERALDWLTTARVLLASAHDNAGAINCTT
jgi:hypothetical protein